MQKLKIDEEFKNLISPPVPDETKQLEENIIKEGCRDSLVVWNGILIDGHNRYAICTKHNIPFNTIEKKFATREEVIDWIIDNQLGRRNITDVQRSYLRGLQYKREKRKVGNFTGTNQFNRNSAKTAENQNQNLTETAKRLADQHKVSERTIREDAQFATAVDNIGNNLGEEVKQKILTKEIKVPKKEVMKISNLGKEEQKRVISGEVHREEKTCNKCNKTKSMLEFYEGKACCRDCHNSQKKSVMKDVYGNKLKTDSELLKGVDLDELISKVKDTNKSAASTDFKTRVAMLKSSTDNFICNADLFFQFCDQLEKTDEGKESLLEIIITLEDVINKIKNII